MEEETVEEKYPLITNTNAYIQFGNYTAQELKDYCIGKGIIYDDVLVVYPKLIYIYFIALDHNDDKSLKQEFFQYLTYLNLSINELLELGFSIREDRIGCTDIRKYCDNIIGEYIYFLYENNKISLEEIENMVDNTDIDHFIAIVTILRFILKDKIINNEDTSYLLKIIDKFDDKHHSQVRYRLYLDDIIVEIGDKRWIEWLINRNKILTKNNERWFVHYLSNMLEQGEVQDKEDYILGVLNELGYDILYLIIGLSSNEVRNYLMNKIDINEVMNVYKRGGGDSSFRDWFEKMTLKQI